VILVARDGRSRGGCATDRGRCTVSVSRGRRAAATHPRPTATAALALRLPAAAPRDTAGQMDSSRHRWESSRGPGGYSLRVPLADLGLKTVLVERYPRLGGVCLNVAASLQGAAPRRQGDRRGGGGGAASAYFGSGKPGVDLDKLRGWKSRW